MKYEKLVKIAVGIVAIVVLFVAAISVYAAVTKPTITTVAGNGLINSSEKASFQVVGTNTATTSASTVTVNLSDGTNSATSTLALLASATNYSATSSATGLSDGTIDVSVWVSDGVATSTVATTTAVLDSAAPTIASTTISSSNASTTLIKAGSSVTLYATSSEAVSTPLINFTFGGVASASTSVVTALSSTAFKAVVYASTTDTEGVVGFSIGSFTDTAGNAVAASSTTLKPSTGTGVTFDKTGPTISSVVYNDIDSSATFSAGDTIVVTFNEAMDVTTATSTNVNTVLGPSGGHTSGTSPTATWTGLTIITVTFGTTPTVVSGDTINPTSAVTDAAGNADASTATAMIAPSTPVSSLVVGTYTSTESATLSSTNSTSIYYTMDDTTPTCSSGILYASALNINHSLTLKAVGCDALLNPSPVLSAAYVINHSGGSSAGGGGGGRNVNAATPAIPAVPGVTPAVPAVPAHKALTMALSRDLSVGSEGDDVVALQTFLEGAGYLVIPNGVAKGYFGGLTKAAVKKFQKAVGLPTPGRVGPATRGILNKDI
jgi:hypothetical protein